MNPKKSKFFQAQEARALAHNPGSCECPQGKPTNLNVPPIDGPLLAPVYKLLTPMLPDDLDVLFQLHDAYGYGHREYINYMNELAPEVGSGFHALYLMGRTIGGEGGKHDGTLEFQLSCARSRAYRTKKPYKDYLTKVPLKKYILLALTYLENHPEALREL